VQNAWVRCVSRPAGVLASCIVLFACTPAPTPSTPPAAPVARPPSDPPAHDPIAAPLEPAPRVGPLHREAPIVFQPATAPAELHRLAKSLRRVAASADGRVRIELGCKSGMQVVEGDHHATLPVRDASAIAIAPRGDAAALEQGGSILVVALPDGRARGSWTGTEPLWLDEDTLAFREGCRWLALARDDATPQPFGESCGERLVVERGARRLWLAELGDEVDTRKPARTLVGLAPGSTELRSELEPGLFAPVLSHDASILCGTFEHEGQLLLQCRHRERGTFERVAQGVSGTPRFAADALRLAFTVGTVGAPQQDLFIADFDTKLVRKVGKVAHHRIEFLPGGDRIVAFDGARGLVFQIDLGIVVPFGDQHDDWVALASSTPESFVAARLRKRCSELVEVRLPSAGTPTSGEPDSGAQ
jgi:hypothetical protein